MSRPPQVSLVVLEVFHSIFVQQVKNQCEDNADEFRSKLEDYGFEVGYRIAEIHSRNRVRLPKEIDALKFMCRDFWAVVFGRSIPNLKTNRKGVYVLIDNSFQWIRRASSLSHRRQLLFFPTGIIRGALACLGVEATVQGESQGTQTCSFTVKTYGSGASAADNTKV